ncbi:hypothetical protein Ocin01_11766 [Orchesella cincta]|uniref:Transglycosylase SLT domain-containing protein n=1 Tax=Orchesella cincta TaxID=48709 RepID=A0A1D2MQ22_ORCCI|nr:hypothetical protein Ocin01_11766 [Orchesella cincta]
MFLRYLLFLVLWLNLTVKWSSAYEGLDVGPSDPLKIGQIDPISLEVASTYGIPYKLALVMVKILTPPEAGNDLHLSTGRLSAAYKVISTYAPSKSSGLLVL